MAKQERVGRTEREELEGLLFEECMGDCECLAKSTFPTSGQWRKRVLPRFDIASGKVTWGMEARDQKREGEWAGNTCSSLI
jgi:hypothetical protein